MKELIFTVVLIFAGMFILKANAQMIVAIDNQDVMIYSSNTEGAPYSISTINQMVNRSQQNDLKAKQAAVVADTTYQTWAGVQQQALNAIANLGE